MKLGFGIYAFTVLLNWFLYYFLKNSSGARKGEGFVPVSFIPALNLVALFFVVHELVTEGADTDKVTNIAYVLPVLSLLGLYFLM
jgi:hypothetical protein